jgi:hypothetical protein
VKTIEEATSDGVDENARTIRDAPAVASMPPSRFGHYRIMGELGRGGMGVVYRARDERSGIDCALKLLPPELAKDEHYAERFKREVRATAKLDHPVLLKVLDDGEQDGTLYFATELAEGGSLRDLLKKQRTIPAPLALLLIDELLDGLAAAHAAGVVHRDLKPENLLLTKAGALKIADFGIAKATDDDTLTKTGALIGTPRYMSPEQARGREVRASSDVFSTGTIFYELLAGSNPFAAGSTSATLVRVIAASTAPIFDVTPTVPAPIEQMIERMHFEDPARRPSAKDARETLTPFVLEASVRHGESRGRLLEQPQETSHAVSRVEAAAERARAKELVAQGNAHAAAFAWWRASLWADDAGVADMREALQLGFKFNAPPSARLASVEQQIRVQPEAPLPLLRAAEAARIDGDLFRAASYMKRYLRLQPSDVKVRNDLAALLGIDRAHVVTAPDAPARMSGAGLELATTRGRSPFAVAATGAPMAAPFANGDDLPPDSETVDAGPMVRAVDARALAHERVAEATSSKPTVGHMVDDIVANVRAIPTPLAVVLVALGGVALFSLKIAFAAGLAVVGGFVLFERIFTKVDPAVDTTPDPTLAQLIRDALVHVDGIHSERARALLERGANNATLGDRVAARNDLDKALELFGSGHPIRAALAEARARLVDP